MASTWIGTGSILDSGDSERMEIGAGEYMEMDPAKPARISGLVHILLGSYVAGDSATIKYKTASTHEGLDGESWTTVTSGEDFNADGYVLIRLEVAA